MPKQNQELEETIETPKEEVEEVQDTEEEQQPLDESEPETDIEDSKEDNSDEEEEVDDKTSKENDNKAWKNSKNAEQARLRREREEELKRKAELFDKTSKYAVNKWTNEPLDSAEAIEEFEIMQEMDRSGADPLSTTEYLKYRREYRAKKEAEVRAAEERQNEAKAQAEKRANKEVDELLKAHTEIKSLQDLFDDKKFEKFSEGKLGGAKTLTQVYEDYLSFTKEFESMTKDKVSKEIAKKSSTPPRPDNEKSSSDSEITPEQLAKMSPEDIAKNWDSIKKALL